MCYHYQRLGGAIWGIPIKDASVAGQLPYQGDKLNAFSTVQSADFITYAKSTNIDAFKELAEKWNVAQASEIRRAPIAPRNGERLRLARLRTAGVALRNRRNLRLHEVAIWIPKFKTGR